LAGEGGKGLCVEFRRVVVHFKIIISGRLLVLYCPPGEKGGEKGKGGKERRRKCINIDFPSPEKRKWCGSRGHEQLRTPPEF
jgi:hypothetical protein